MEQKIKTITTILINDETPEEGVIFMREERDLAGNQISIEQLSYDGSIESKTTRTFDSENKMITEAHYSANKEPDQSLTYTYNQEGKIEKITIVYRDGSISNVNYKRDVTENSTEIKTVDPDGYLEAKEYRKFDMEGRVLEEGIYGEEGVLESRIVSSYNDSGRPIERSFEYGDGRAFTHFYDYEFDAEGRLTFMEAYDKDEQSIRVDDLVYDQNGNQIEHRIQDHEKGYSIIDKGVFDEANQLIKQIRSFANGHLIQEKEYVRDENNLLIKEETTGEDGVMVYVFKYDFH